MATEVWRELTFEAAHLLPDVAEGHKCGRLHGHSYRVRFDVAGEVDPVTGWVLDFADIGGAAGAVVDRLDHRYLNEIEGLHNPTSEVLAEWLFERVAPVLPGLVAVHVSETCTSGVTHRPG